MICALHKYYQGAQIEKDEMDWACNTNGKDDKFKQNICRKKPEGKKPLWTPEYIQKNDIKINVTQSE